MYWTWSSITVTLVGGFTIVSFYLWAKWKHSYWRRRGIPSLPTHLLFGNFKDAIFMKLSAAFLLGRLYREVDEDAPFVGIYIMHTPYLLLRSPDIIKNILVKDFDAFSDRYFATPETSDDLVVSRGLFSLKNPQWRFMRTKLSPTFSSGKIKSLFELMLESSESLKNYLEGQLEKSAKGEISLDFKDASNRYTTDVISSMAFGVRTDSFQDPPSEFYIRSRYVFTTTIIRVLQLFVGFFFPKLKNLVGGSLLGKHTDFFRKIFWSSMDSRENGKYQRGDVIDSLLKLKNEKSESHGFELGGDTLLAQSALFFVAGLETTATTIAFTLWELAKHPDIQDRVRRDIHEHLDESKQVTYRSIHEMKYLMSVINETLRMYPAAPLIDRVATRDYKIPGTEILLEKGSVIYIALPGLHMDPKFHRDPERYDPDRFSDERKSDIKPFTFMPFGEGPRTCIGLRVGVLLTAVGLITVLRDHEVSINEYEWRNRVSPKSVFTAPSDGITLNLKKISANKYT